MYAQRTVATERRIKGVRHGVTRTTTAAAFEKRDSYPAQMYTAVLRSCVINTYYTRTIQRYAPVVRACARVVHLLTLDTRARTHRRRQRLWRAECAGTSGRRFISPTIFSVALVAPS